MSIQKTWFLPAWLAQKEGPNCELHPLIHTSGIWGLATKCWGETRKVGTKHILPICELPGNSRYEKEIETFWWDVRVHIYSRYVYIRPYQGHDYIW